MTCKQARISATSIRARLLDLAQSRGQNFYNIWEVEYQYIQ
jgi:hypothetical protein